MLKLKDIVCKLPRHDYITIFKNDDLIFDDLPGNIPNEILNEKIHSLVYLDESDLSIDLK